MHKAYLFAIPSHHVDVFFHHLVMASILKVQTSWLIILIFFLLFTKSLSLTIFAIIVTGGAAILLLEQPHWK